MNTHFLVYAGKNVFEMLLRLVIGCMTPVPGSYLLTGNEHHFLKNMKWETKHLYKNNFNKGRVKKKVENSTFGSGSPLEVEKIN